MHILGYKLHPIIWIEVLLMCPFSNHKSSSYITVKVSSQYIIKERQSTQKSPWTDNNPLNNTPSDNSVRVNPLSQKQSTYYGRKSQYSFTVSLFFSPQSCVWQIYNMKMFGEICCFIFLEWYYGFKWQWSSKKDVFDLSGDKLTTAEKWPSC